MFGQDANMKKSDELNFFCEKRAVGNRTSKISRRTVVNRFFVRIMLMKNIEIPKK